MLWTEGSQSAAGADTPVRRVRPRVGPRRERGKERFESLPVHLRRSRGSGWDRATLPRLPQHVESGSRRPSACAVRKAVPGSRTVRIKLASCALESYKSLVKRILPGIDGFYVERASRVTGPRAGSRVPWTRAERVRAGEDTSRSRPSIRSAPNGRTGRDRVPRRPGVPRQTREEASKAGAATRIAGSCCTPPAPKLHSGVRGGSRLGGNCKKEGTRSDVQEARW